MTSTKATAPSASIKGFILTTIAYWGVARLSLLLAIPPGYATPVWPAAGVALVAVLLGGMRLAPAVLLGSFLANLPTSLDSSAGSALVRALSVPLGISAGAALQAIAGASLIRRMVRYPTPLIRPTEIGLFLLLGGPAACLVSAGIGQGVLTAAGIITHADIPSSFATWWIGDSIGVLFTVPVLLAYLGEPAEAWRLRRHRVAVPVALFSLLFLIAFLQISRSESDRISGEFVLETDLSVDRTRDDLERYEDVLSALRGFFAGSQRIQREEFGIFSRHLLNRLPGVRALEWAPRVAHADRERYEAEARAESNPGFRFTERGETGLVARASKEEYYPVLYVEPLQGNENVLGFDLTSNNHRRAALEEARDGGDPRASEPITLVQAGTHIDGYLIAVPVYDSPDIPGDTATRRTNLRGFLIGVFEAGRVLGAIADRGTASGIESMARDIRSGRVMIGDTTWPAAPPEARDLGLDRKVRIDLPGRPWEIRFIGTKKFIREHSTILPWAVLAGGILFSSLLGAFLLVVTGSAVEVQQLAELRARQLTKAHLMREQILNNTIDAIITIDEKGIIESVNPATIRLFGYTESEMIGQNVKILMPEPYHGEHDGYLAAYVKTGQSKIIGRGREVFGRHKSGSVFPVDLGVSEMSVDGRRLFTGILRDITARRQAEEQLRAARDEADAANRSKGEFLANISHEIRTPLNAVLGFTELLRNTARDEREQGYIDSILTSGQALLALINDILDMSRIEAGRMSVSPEPCNLHDLVREIGLVFRQRAADKGVVFSTAIDEGVPQAVLVDPARLRQILFNLVGNAVKFTEKGEVRMALNALPAGEKTVDVSFSVRDTGIGIPTESLESIFEPFVQQSGQSTRQYGGTGLGLPISRRLATMMGGAVTAESVVGEGSVFTVLLPGLSVVEERRATEQAPLPTFQAATVLIADDTPLNRTLIREMLRGSGLESCEAEDGAAALAMVRDRRPALVLMDIVMPTMDGIEASRRLRAAPETARLPILAVTASAHKIPEGLFDAVLPKPLTRTTLLRTLALHLAVAEKTAFLSAEPKDASTPEPVTLAPLDRAAAREFLERWEAAGADLWRTASTRRQMREIRRLAGWLRTEADSWPEAAEIGTNLAAASDQYRTDRIQTEMERLERWIENVRRIAAGG